MKYKEELPETKRCLACKGAGKMFGKCLRCNGKGKLTKKELQHYNWCSKLLTSL